MSFLQTYHIKHEFPAEGIKINLAASDQAGALAALLQVFLGQLKQELQQMANQMDEKLAIVLADVTQMKTVVGSAAAMISSFPRLLATAVEDALAKGATASQLQSVTDVATTVEAMQSDLAAAIAANTSADTGTGAPGGTTVGGPSVGGGSDTATGTDPNGAPAPAV